jgi:hypothetical protein
MGDTTREFALWKVRILCCAGVRGDQRLGDRCRTPINAIAIDPLKASRIFVGTDIGVSIPRIAG